MSAEHPGRNIPRPASRWTHWDAGAPRPVAVRTCTPAVDVCGLSVILRFVYMAQPENN